MIDGDRWRFRGYGRANSLHPDSVNRRSWRVSSWLMPACRGQTTVTTRSASALSRRRCWQEAAAPPPFLRRPRSTPPVSLRSVRRVPACRAIRSVPRAPALRAPPDRFPCHRRARAVGVARWRSGSRPRPVRDARAGRHSEGLPRQSCRSRHERSGADLGPAPRRRRGMREADGCSRRSRAHRQGP